MSETAFFYLNTNNNNNPESSSRIYLLKQKSEQYKHDYLEGEFGWNSRKNDILNNWANCLEELINYGQLEIEIDGISSYISAQLRDAGLEQGSIDYIRQVLPQKYKNSNKIREFAENSTQNTVYDDEDNEDVELTQNQQKNLFAYKRKVDQLSPTEIQEEYLKVQQEAKERRVREKAKKELLEQLSIQKKIPLPFYKKTSAEIPPEVMHGVTYLSRQIHLLGEDHQQIAKYLFDIEKSIIEFKPDEQRGQELGKLVEQHRNTFIKVLKSLYVPYSDKKWSADTLEWIRIQLSKIDHGKNAAGTIHSQPTGEIAVKKNKDGTYTYIKLDRDITREQVGDNSEDILTIAKLILENNPAFMQIMALHDWSYNTYVQEGEIPV